MTFGRLFKKKRYAVFANHRSNIYIDCNGDSDGSSSTAVRHHKSSLSIYVLFIRRQVVASPLESEPLNGTRTIIQGLEASEEAAVALLLKRFPTKPYCLIEDWTIFRADLTPEEITKVHAANHLPLFVFAHKVVEDSRGRFQPGDWVRSSMCTTFEGGVFFETRNTVYVLLGPGHEQTASLKTIFSFF
jgi:hypothetical protein